MRPEVQKLLDIARDRWRFYRDGRSYEYLANYREAYPRILSFGVELNDQDFLGFDQDEKLAVSNFFNEVKERETLRKQESAWRALVGFVNNYK